MMYLKTQLINKAAGRGWIEVICGSMFSGKTEELIRRLKRAQFAKQKIVVVKPALDTRYDKKNVVSHNKNSLEAIPVENALAILGLAGDIDVLGIDEAQFFDAEILTVCNTLANNGVRVIAAGLDMDFSGKPFGVMPGLMAIAEDVSKVHAICVSCGNLAQFSHRKTLNEEVVMLGEEKEYEPLCRSCFVGQSKK